MRIFPPALVIGEREGFTPDKDIFNRADFGAGLTHLVGAVSDPLVIALDGKWGTGKTTFLAMWAGELRNAGFPVVRFDAFEHDYMDDAFTAIAGEIIALAQELRVADTPAGRKFLEKAVGAGRVLLRTSLKLGIKIGTLNALEASDISDVAAEFSDEAAELVDKHVGELLTTHKKQQETLDAFRQALSDLPTLLATSAESEDQEGPPKPLIFIIDELDRCKPLFALEILERIKHFFQVPGVHFVLGAHIGQLRNSVSVAYGSGIDNHMYLQKFIQLTFVLSEHASHEHERVINKYMAFLARALDFTGANSDSVKYGIQVIREVADKKQYSLRTIERIMTTFSLALAVTPQNRFQAPAILGGLCVMKVTAPDLFAKAKNGSLTIDEAADALGLDLSGDPADQEWTTKWFRFALEKEPPPEIAERMRQSLFDYHMGRESIVPIIANTVIDRLKP